MMAHTPGPWRAVKLNVDKHGIIKTEAWEIDTPEYCVAGHMPHRAPFRREADAMLAAAAPELLAACEYGRKDEYRSILKDAVSKLREFGGADDWLAGELERKSELEEAAIASAKGESDDVG